MGKHNLTTMGNVCSNDENKDLDMKVDHNISNQQTSGQSGLRTGLRDETEKENAMPLSNSNLDESMKNSGKLYENLPPVQELPEYYNKEVNLTMSNAGKFNYDESNALNQSQSPDLTIECSKKFFNSDF